MELTWTPEGGSPLPLTAPYYLPSHSGFGGAPATVQTQTAPDQRGESLIDVSPDPRPISLEYIIHASREHLFARRRELITAFSGPGTLVCKIGGRTFKTCCAPEGGPSFPGGKAQGMTWQTALINLLAPDPYFYDPAEETVILKSFTGGWKFPWSFPRKFGTAGGPITLINEGDVSTPITITITGYTRYPIITNETTGERIMVDVEVPEGRILEIITQFGNKHVELIDLDGNNRTNVYGDVVRDSRYSMWELRPGENIIRYDAAEVVGGQASIRYFHKFSGI